MKYKYIGTEEQLIEHGFIIRKQYGVAIRKHKIDYKKLFINLDMCDLYEQNIIQYNYNDNEINPSDIQDLIEANLVEVIK